MHIDPWILTFSALTVIATIWMGFWSARRSKTAHDFYVAGRSVSVGWNASAISGEYLSAASFMGVAGMVMSSGYDALWYPVCYACGYLFLLLFIAGPLRRFGAYTIPDFAEGRFDSPLFRKIAVVFVLFIGFFYTMPQMKGAGTTLAYIFPGLPYWAGVVLVGAVITLNVALGGMKGITLVQAFQYWAKMFAISTPIFVLMAVYGHYGKQLGVNVNTQTPAKPMTGKNLRVSPEEFPGEFQVETASVTYNGKLTEAKFDAERLGLLKVTPRIPFPVCPTTMALSQYANLRPSFANYYTNYIDKAALRARLSSLDTSKVPPPAGTIRGVEFRAYLDRLFASNGLAVLEVNKDAIALVMATNVPRFTSAPVQTIKPQSVTIVREPLPDKAPGDSTALADAQTTNSAGIRSPSVSLRGGSSSAIIARELNVGPAAMVVVPTPTGVTGAVNVGNISVSVPGPIAAAYFSNGLAKLEPRVSGNVARVSLPEKAPADSTWLSPFGPLTTKAAKAAGITGEAAKPYSLLYTYSLIIALVCGTAGLPHILVRFYTNPDGVAAKRTTMWVMILIGIFYVFPPVFGVMGRNLLPDLYAGVGAKGTDKIVLELPRILNERYAPLGSILSGITCAGAFAAFMSTFSGLLVSMTGALAHDVYGRMFRPKSTPEQRLRAFKVCTVLIGGIAIVLGCFVEPLEINFMVGQAFAIAAASYFPLLFMSVWWRGMTMRGAATGMLTGGLCALAAVTLTNVSNLALDKGPMGKVFAGFAPLNPFWAGHPLLRILCEQPAIWTVPLAIGLMIVIGKLTSRAVPPDTRMKMLVLHAPEKLGLKQEYIQEHQKGE